MIKHFCNRCGEILQPSGNTTGAVTRITGPPGKEAFKWTVEMKISFQEHNWALCRYCCDELLDIAYKSIVQMRVKEETEKPDTH